MLQPFNPVPHFVLPLTRKVTELLLHNHNFAAAMNHNINIFERRGLPKGCNPQVENPWIRTTDDQLRHVTFPLSTQAPLRVAKRFEGASPDAGCNTAVDQTSENSVLDEHFTVFNACTKCW